MDGLEVKTVSQEPELRKWQMPGKQRLRHMEQGYGRGLLKDSINTGVRTKADFGKDEQ